MELEIRGIEELSKALKKRADLTDVKNVVKMNGSELERRMKRNASFKGHYDSSGRFVKPSGATKRSIELTIMDGGFTARVRPTTHYSPYLEYGTRFMTAQPFVRPSFFTQRKQFIKDMQRLTK